MPNMQAMERFIVAISSLGFIAATMGCSSDGKGSHGSAATGDAGAADADSSDAAGAAGMGGAPPELLLQTESGPVRGTVSGRTRAFFGIPFAAPPLGSLRWRPPQAPAEWTEPLDATRLGPNCPQIPPGASDYDPGTREDCLTLNVWAPEVAPRSPLPVVVGIHGGGLVVGGSGDYVGDTLVPEANVLLVTFNYRLGALGFLAHPDLNAEDARTTSGNYGFLDQRFALQWVRRNIGAFGGDPDNVTLLGESAGGASVCDHLLAPESRGLFQGAIIESGPCGLEQKPLSAGEALGVEFEQAVGCSAAADKLACMRAADAATIVTALPNFDVVRGSGAEWSTLVDGVVFPQSAELALSKGAFNRVPTIIGSNKDEGTLFVWSDGLLEIDAAAYAALVATLAPRLGSDAASLLAEYPAEDYPTPGRALASLIGEARFNCPTRRSARALAAANVDTFLYHFERAPGVGAGAELGAYHTSELSYVFDLPLFGVTPLPATDLSLAETMRGYWGRFAASHNPNGNAAPAWPAYAATTDQHLVFDLGEVRSGRALRAQKCDFWDGVQTH
jgi:para-nitrobenzyl esterase